MEPGYCRAFFLAQDSLALPETTVDVYPAMREMVRNHLALEGSQLGDSERGAEAIIGRVTAGTGPPLRQLLGSDDHAYASAEVAALQENLDRTRESAPVTDFAAGRAHTAHEGEGPVESRITRCDGNTRWDVLGACDPSPAPSSRSTASLPASAKWPASVVSGGEQKSAPKMSS